MEVRGEEPEHTLDVLPFDLVAPDSRTASDIGELVGHLQRSDEQEVPITQCPEDVAVRPFRGYQPETHTFVLMTTRGSNLSDRGGNVAVEAGRRRLRTAGDAPAGFQ